jgi:hypothetical protein
MVRTTFCAAVLLAMTLQTWARDQAAQSEGTAGDIGIAAPSEGGPRRWQVQSEAGLDMHASPAVDATVIGTLADAAILVNLGCEHFNNRIWCHVKPLRSRIQGYVMAQHLRPARGPDGVVPMGNDDSAQRARQGDFDARGQIRCAQVRGQPMGECTYGVARGSGGDATVIVTFPNGFKRALFFSHGQFIRADTTMSGTGFDVDWKRQGTLHVIRVDGQRYELCDVTVFGNQGLDNGTE